METLSWSPSHPLYDAYSSMSVTSLDLKNLDMHVDDDFVRFSGIVRDMMDFEICEIDGVQCDRLPIICDVLPHETYWTSASRKRRVNEEMKTALPTESVILYIYGNSNVNIKINDMIEVFGKYNSPCVYDDTPSELSLHPSQPPHKASSSFSSSSSSSSSPSSYIISPSISSSISISTDTVVAGEGRTDSAVAMGGSSMGGRIMGGNSMSGSIVGDNSICGSIMGSSMGGKSIMAESSLGGCITNGSSMDGSSISSSKIRGGSSMAESSMGRSSMGGSRLGCRGVQLEDNANFDEFENLDDLSNSLASIYPQIDCESFLILGPSYPLLLSSESSSSTAAENSTSSSSSSTIDMSDRSSNSNSSSSSGGGDGGGGESSSSSDDSGSLSFRLVGRGRDPFLHSSSKPFDYKSFISAMSSSVRELVINELRIAYGGDLLCSEYTLLAIVSKIYDRPADVGFLGALTLNISAFDQDRMNGLVQALSRMVPRIAHSPVSVEALNDKLWMPTKDYKHNCLLSSPLQFPSGTIALIDETDMSEGHLTSQGIKSVKALNKVASDRMLPVDYSFYELDIPIDFIPIFFSSGTSLCCKHEKVIKVVQTNDPSFNLHTYKPLLEDGFDNLRLWLATVRELSPSMAKETAVMVEQDFVEARNANSEVSVNDLHNWLTIARLVAVSHGSEVITCEHWAAMKDLESRRTARLS